MQLPEDAMPWTETLDQLKSRKKVPAFVEPIDTLPPITGEGGSLSEARLSALLKLLAAQDATPIAEDLREWATAASLGAFAWELHTRWGKKKYNKAGSWVLHAVALFGHAEAGQIVKVVKTWGSSRKKTDRGRAARLVNTLGEMGSEDAGRALVRLDRQVYDDELAATIQGNLALVAKKLDEDPDEMAMRLFPPEQELAGLTDPKKLPSLLKGKLPTLLARDGSELEALPIIRAFHVDPREAKGMAGLLSKIVQADSGEDFALAMLECWKSKDYNGRYSWIGNGLRIFGRDRVALELEPLVKGWAAGSDRERDLAVSLLPLFSDIGTDTALLVLLGLNQIQVRPKVVIAAERELRRAARSRGVSVDDLADHITPTCGLDARGSRTFDYGGRRFVLVFDDHFDPVIQAEDGSRSLVLPSPTPQDEPEQVATAQKDYALVRDQLEAILEIQTKRLERALEGGRRWSVEAWKAQIHGHPLLVNYARRLAWAVFDGEGVFQWGFRAAEDDTFVSLDHDEISLPEGAFVGLLHPLHIGIERCRDWGEHFADYELINPFPQLERSIHSPESEANKEVCQRFTREPISGARLRQVLILERGWSRDSNQGYVRTSYFKRYPGASFTAVAHFEPGITAGGGWGADDQTVTLSFVGPAKKRVRLDEVDPVVFSESCIDLTAAAQPVDF